MSTTDITSDVAFAGLARQAELIREGELTSRELTELCLARIAEYDSDLNAFRIVLGERALAEADQADQRRAEGDERPLLGVPVAIKDCYDVAGQTTPNGSHGASSQPVDRDSEVTRRLREAGAIVIGKTNVPELCVLPFTETIAYGTTRNPWNLEHSSGGSSGGSAAAVAAGLVGAAVASDGGGSIRIPAACCGLFGLKPQRGRVSLAPYAEHWHGLSVMNSVTRTVADSALFLDIVAGPAPGDADSAPAPERPFAEAAATPPGELRIALARNLPPSLARPSVDDEVDAATLEIAAVLRRLGHHVTETELDYGNVANDFSVRFMKGIQQDVDALPHPERVERRTARFARIGRLMPNAALRRARANEAAAQARIGAIYADHDVVLTHATARTAWPIGLTEGRGPLRTLLACSQMTPLTPVWNHLGWPAAAVPAGISQGGLPLSVQLLGRENDEATLLSLAAQLEAELDLAERPAAGLLSPPPAADAHSLAALAESLARAAGAQLLEAFGGPAVGVQTKSSATDFVSEADLAAERLIRSGLAEARPGDAILGEEGGGDERPQDGLRWVVDPLDGTTNFLFGIPQWCVSVACEDEHGSLAGAIYDPCRGELFRVARGSAPTLDGSPVSASEQSDLGQALVATGFAYAAQVRARQAEVLTRVLPAVRDLRRAGSAALDLAWTAAGRLDAYFERGLEPWDRAAGQLMCAEAGLVLAELEPAGDDWPRGLVAAPRELAAPLLALVG